MDIKFENLNEFLLGLSYPTRRNIVDTGVGGIELEDENSHQQGDVLQTQFLLDYSLIFWSEQH
jgi:hypothetical protein